MSEIFVKNANSEIVVRLDFMAHNPLEAMREASKVLLREVTRIEAQRGV